MTKRNRQIRAMSVACLGLIVVPGALAAQRPAETETRAEAVQLLQRATHGARPEDVGRVLEMGVAAWLDEQLHPESIDDPAQGVVARRFPATAMSIDELLETYPPGMILRPLRQALEGDSLPEAEAARLRRELGRASPGRILGDLVGARLYRSAFSERQLEEVMTAFWFDHFNVFFGKGATRWLVADYERNAIRPHVFGTFEDLLVATARHPAMLFYLDNFRSAAPDSSTMARRLRAMDGGAGGMRPSGRPGPDVRRPGRPGRGPAVRGRRPDDAGGARDMNAALQRIRRSGMGLNENYARELLELHTLGVDGGYSQDDVIAVARVFTGWSFEGPGNRRMLADVRDRVGRGDTAIPSLDFDGAYRFQYRPFLHDAGEKVVLGETFPAGSQEEEGLRVLKMLARHPSTARRVATQLATRFVADDPPSELVDELADVFLATGGDLREVTRALFTSDLFYAPEHRNGRIKSPTTLVASALRLTGARLGNPRGALEALRTLGEAPYLAEPPTGYEEASGAWLDSGSLLNRMNLGIALADGTMRGVRVDRARMIDRARALSDDDVAGLVALLIPGAHGTEPTATEPTGTELTVTVREALRDAGAASEDERAAAALGLILGSPRFQRH